MRADPAELRRLLETYASAFDEFDAKKIVSFLDVPCLITSAHGSSAFTSTDQLIENFEAINDNHRSLDYHHADLLAFEVTRSDVKHFADADVRWSFRRKDGSEIYEFGMIYVFREVDGGWKICCAINTDG